MSEVCMKSMTTSALALPIGYLCRDVFESVPPSEWKVASWMNCTVHVHQAPYTIVRFNSEVWSPLKHNLCVFGSSRVWMISTQTASFTFMYRAFLVVDGDPVYMYVFCCRSSKGTHSSKFERHGSNTLQDGVNAGLSKNIKWMFVRELWLWVTFDKCLGARACLKVSNTVTKSVCQIRTSPFV